MIEHVVIGMLHGFLLTAGFGFGFWSARRHEIPDLDLLRKFADGVGGRRTGDLIRRGWLKVEVTEAGREALRK